MTGVPFPPPIYRSEFCEVNSYTPNYPDPTESFYIGNADESYDSPNWPTREAMIADLEGALAALRCRCATVHAGDNTVVGKNWNPDCPVHPWDDRLQADADRAVELQRLAGQARAGTLPCRKCGTPILATQHRFGSPETGYEHMEGECR